MEQAQAIKQMESSLSLVGDHVSVLGGKLEDLLFRAQRISHAKKDDAKAQVTDTMFGYDLQNFRRDIRAFTVELGGLSNALGAIERNARACEADVIRSQSVLRLASRLQRSATTLQEQSLLAHQHIRSAEHKVEAWYLVQEIEGLVSLTQPLAGIANKVVVAVSSPTPAAPAVRAPAPAAMALAKPRVSVPMRPVAWTAPAPTPTLEPAEG